MKAIQPSSGSAASYYNDEVEQKRTSYFELAENFFSKCLEVSNQCGFKDKVAECHQ